MNNYIDAYEKDLINSTELINEGFFKKKLSRKGYKLQETIINVCKRYKLKPLRKDGKLKPFIRRKKRR